MKFYLSKTIKQLWPQAKFADFMRLRGKIFRQQKQRLTMQILIQPTSYFIKQHFGIGWKEICKNLLQWRWPVLGASNEYYALQLLKQHNIRAPQVLAFGEQGINPAARQSFILMEDLSPAPSLEDLLKEWRIHPPHIRYKRSLIRAVAETSRNMHKLGMNHRDFYICHFLLLTPINSLPIQLALIDLHRAQIRKRVPLRWLIKDLAGLYFSSHNSGLTRNDLLRFACVYQQQSVRQVLMDNKFWQRIIDRGEKLYRDHAS